MRWRVRIACAAAGALCLAAVGCDSSQSEEQRIGSKDPVVTQLPQVQVKLPPPPSFKKEHAPEKYPDGAYSVYGVRKGEKETLDKEVKVRGFIIEIYECPPCPKGSNCPACDKPHFWLGDRANTPKDKAMMVTDYPKEDPQTKKKLTFELKGQYYVSGLFAKRSGTGFASSEGLMRFTAAVPVAAAAQ